MEKDFAIEDIITVMKMTKKIDPLFKPLKKLKTAIESIGLQNISFLPTNRLLVFHFGLGNQLDKEILLSTQPENLEQQISIIPGHSYCILDFGMPQHALHYLSSKRKIQGRPLFYQEVPYQNLKRTMVFLFCKEEFMKEQQVFNIPNCPSKYTPDSIPGLILLEDILTKEEELILLEQIDLGHWEKLNNRRVQHHGYAFKYGRNQIDKEENQGELPQYLDKLLQRLYAVPILKGMEFDQLTINDYFAGNGIPAHFDTHSPFEEVFIAVSLLSGIVMDWRKYDGQQRSVYLKERSVVIFSGEARYAWTHAISCRKLDKIDNEIVHRSRRLSLTFRKIRFSPCKCPYYFYCDSQGYNQETMKKNNPLLAKYLSNGNTKVLESLEPAQIEKQYVCNAYNGFGFDFHNKVIPKIRTMLEGEVEATDLVLDIGCGNGEYLKYLHEGVEYIGVQKCVTMVAVQNQFFMDCKSLCFRSETFDKVIFVAVLHHLASQETRFAALIECHRVLKSKGVVYLTVLSYEQKQEIYSTQDIILEYCLPNNKVAQKQRYITKNIDTQSPRIEERGQIFKRYYHLFTLPEMMNLISKVGFKVDIAASQGQNHIFRLTKQ